MAKLLLFLQDGSAREVLFDKENIIVGRRSDNDVSLPFPTVSGRHAKFTFIAPDQCYVEDLKSTNGTLLNGQLLAERKQVHDRDQVDIGGQKFVYLEGSIARVENGAKPQKPTTRGVVAPTAAETHKVSETLKLASRHERIGATNEGHHHSVSGSNNEGTKEEDASEESHSGLHFPTIFRIPTRRRMVAQQPAEEEPNLPPPVDDDYAANVVTESSDALLEEATDNMPPPVAVIEALSGPNYLRKLFLRSGEYVLGRPGFQLALVRVNEEGCRLLPMEGEPPLELHGETLPAEGALLKDQDTFTVSNTPLQFFEIAEEPREPEEAQEAEGK